jgi:hypothetical protein
MGNIRKIELLCGVFMKIIVVGSENKKALTQKKKQKKQKSIEIKKRLAFWVLKSRQRGVLNAFNNPLAVK